MEFRVKHYNPSCAHPIYSLCVCECTRRQLPACGCVHLTAQCLLDGPSHGTHIMLESLIYPKTLTSATHFPCSRLVQLRNSFRDVLGCRRVLLAVSICVLPIMINVCSPDSVTPVRRHNVEHTPPLSSRLCSSIDHCSAHIVLFPFLLFIFISSSVCIDVPAFTFCPRYMLSLSILCPYRVHSVTTTTTNNLCLIDPL